jgi:hypothetical protein
MLEVLECLCQDRDEEQNLLGQLLSKSDTWPLWINPDLKIPKVEAALDVENAPIDIHVSGIFNNFFCLLDLIRTVMCY